MKPLSNSLMCRYDTCGILLRFSSIWSRNWGFGWFQTSLKDTLQRSSGKCHCSTIYFREEALRIRSRIELNWFKSKYLCCVCSLRFSVVNFVDSHPRILGRQDENEPNFSQEETQQKHHTGDNSPPIICSPRRYPLLTVWNFKYRQNGVRSQDGWPWGRWWEKPIRTGCCPNFHPYQYRQYECSRRREGHPIAWKWFRRCCSSPGSRPGSCNGDSGGEEESYRPRHGSSSCEEDRFIFDTYHDLWIWIGLLW